MNWNKNQTRFEIQNLQRLGFTGMLLNPPSLSASIPSGIYKRWIETLLEMCKMKLPTRPLHESVTEGKGNPMNVNQCRLEWVITGEECHQVLPIQFLCLRLQSGCKSCNERRGSVWSDIDQVWGKPLDQGFRRYLNLTLSIKDYVQSRGVKSNPQNIVFIPGSMWFQSSALDMITGYKRIVPALVYIHS